MSKAKQLFEQENERGGGGTNKQRKSTRKRLWYLVKRVTVIKDS